MAIGAAIAAIEQLVGAGLLPSGLGSLAVAALFLGLPLLPRLRPAAEPALAPAPVGNDAPAPVADASPVADPHGFGPGPWPRALAIGLLVSAAVLPLFAFGYDLVAKHVWHQPARSMSALWAPPLEVQGLPPRRLGQVSIGEARTGLRVENGRTTAIVLLPTCPDPACAPLELRPGASATLTPLVAAGFELRDAGGKPLPPSQVRVGAGDRPPDASATNGAARVEAGFSLLWLFWLLLDQWIVVALPEEAFFRGWMLDRLRRRWPSARKLFGTPFGAPHVLSALLFAAIHLFAVPSPYRLAVFFPGLLFAWVRERGGHVGAAIACHALSNVALAAIQRCYGVA